MSELTELEALDLTAEIWRWVAEQPNNTRVAKYSWPGWKRNGGTVRDMNSSCPICEEGFKRGCDSCLLVRAGLWKRCLDGRVNNPYSNYSGPHDAIRIAEAAEKMAREIRSKQKRQMFCPDHNAGDCVTGSACGHRGNHNETPGCKVRCPFGVSLCVSVDETPLADTHKTMEYSRHCVVKAEVELRKEREPKKTTKTYGRIGQVKHIIHDEDVTISFRYPRRVVIKVEGHEIVLVL